MDQEWFADSYFGSRQCLSLIVPVVPNLVVRLYMVCLLVLNILATLLTETPASRCPIARLRSSALRRSIVKMNEI